MTITIYRARRIVTMNPGRPDATHVAVRDGRVLGTGSMEELALWGPHLLDERFAAKVLSDAEMATWKARSARWPERGVRYLATRFSAKEAFSKAIGLGMRMPMTWRLCEVAKLPSGQPVIVLHGVLKDWFEAKNLSAHITVTDESEYAASFCVVETQSPPRP